MIVILGGGLSGSLLAYRLSQLDPQPDFLLIEEQEQLGGNHTWSFHESDLSTNSMAWIRNLISSSWNQQEVRFHNFNRILAQRYHSVTSTRLNQIIQSQIRNRLILGKPVLKVDSHRIYLQDRQIEAQTIFDARGIEREQLKFFGFQKFVGMDLEFSEPHGIKHPVIMDANCKQEDGYRFFYLLPWNSHSVLIEDTRYSSSPDIDIETFKEEIRNYCKRSGWTIQRELRSEMGTLPIPLSPFIPKLETSEIISIGMKGGFFHWTTGYSFPYAVQIAEEVSGELERNPNTKSADFASALKPIQNEIEMQSKYFSILNRMLFLAAKPSERWRIFHRFYRLNEDLICRFYRGKLKLVDQARILIGRPPVPIYSAFNSIFNFKKYPNVYETHTSETRQ